MTMSVNESQRLMLQQFERKLIPNSISIDSLQYKAFENEDAYIKNWRWSQYPFLYSLNHHHIEKPMKTLKEVIHDKEEEAHSGKHL